MIGHPEVDQLALGLVAAIQRDDYDGAAALLDELERDDLVTAIVVLATTLGAAWRELCDSDGVDFNEFIYTSGVWLAEMETP